MSGVETETGERMRQDGIRILTGRYRELVARSKRFAFSQIEGDEMRSVGTAIDTLTAMQPAGSLQPPHSKDWFATAS